MSAAPPGSSAKVLTQLTILVTEAETCYMFPDTTEFGKGGRLLYTVLFGFEVDRRALYIGSGYKMPMYNFHRSR